ncbi:substrate-binding domain-containing protein, partial [Micromonospora zhanjiangensis]
ELATYTDPPLTTVRQPILQIGRRMTGQVLRIIDGQTVEPALVLDTELVVRQSG